MFESHDEYDIATYIVRCTAMFMIRIVSGGRAEGRRVGAGHEVCAGTHSSPSTIDRLYCIGTASLERTVQQYVVSRNAYDMYR